jgi:FlaA1/EpsC-like NDP-sugar epimerase
MGGIAESGPTCRSTQPIPEAVQLVLQAGALLEAAGRISILEMGEPVRILDLAENLIRLSGMEPYTDVPIVFTGLRPGEKLYEELMYDVEVTVQTSIEKVRVVETDETDGRHIVSCVERLSNGVAMGDGESLLPLVRELVPEYKTPDLGSRPPESVPMRRIEPRIVARV